MSLVSQSCDAISLLSRYARYFSALPLTIDSKLGRQSPVGEFDRRHRVADQCLEWGALINSTRVVREPLRQPDNLSDPPNLSCRDLAKDAVVPINSSRLTIAHTLWSVSCKAPSLAAFLVRGMLSLRAGMEGRI